MKYVNDIVFAAAILLVPFPAFPFEGSEWLSVADAQVYAGKVENGTLAAPGTSWFVRSLENAGEIISAKWTTAGLGVYDVYVNGKRVGDDFLKPGFTHYAKTKYSFAYDVTGLMKTAVGERNVFAAEVSAGWWRDKIVSVAAESGGFVGKKSAFRGILELTFRDGSIRRYGTNVKDWKAGIAGPVTQAAIFDGEHYDARLRPGYELADTFAAPEVNTEFKGEILPTDGAEVVLRRDRTLKPIKAYTWKGVEGNTENAFGKVKIVREFREGEPMTIDSGETLVLDFGQNAAAVPEFRFSAERGTVLTALPAEMLNDRNGLKARGNDGPEGSVYRVNLRAGHEDGRQLSYVFSGEGTEEYMPRFTFFGYRYVAISATAKVTIASAVSIPVTSIRADQERGSITTGDECLNRLISNVYWGQISNYLSVPTDCPQRNERLGWTADTQVFTEAASYNADVYDFLRKWMRDMRDSQYANGAFPSVAPVAQYGEAPDRLGWSDAGVIVPYVMWRQCGDLRIVRENWAAMERYMTRLSETKGATLPGNSQYADWLSFEKYQACGAPWRKNPPKAALAYWDYLGASYWLWDARMMRELAAALGDSAAERKYAVVAEAALGHLRERFVEADGLVLKEFRELQTACVFALKSGLLTSPAAVEKTKALLRANIDAHGGCLQTGFLGTAYLMQVLSENGMNDVAVSVLLNHRFPGWLYSVDQGATTIWERWNSYTLDKGFGPVEMNSFNHYAYGAVLAWMYRTLAGIAADSSCPGFRRIVMKPMPDRRLGHVTAEFRSPVGLIKSAWRYESGKWIWNFTVPEGAVASVTAPGSAAATEYAPGDYEIVRYDAEPTPFDFARTAGPVKPVNGVGQPPMSGLTGFKNFRYLKEAGIPYSRLHDVGGSFGGFLFVDIPNLFRDFSADEDDPASYDFHYTDLLLKALDENGVEPYFRLGVTIENAAGAGHPAYRIFPPADYAKWARVCEHVIRHYTEGWANGFRMKISHWEIWNEPDSFETVEKSMMWKAPFSEYIRLYSVAAPYLKSKFPRLKIGGFASCGLYGVASSWAKPSNPRIVHLHRCFEDFLSACRDQKLPLDYFSCHCYDFAEFGAKQFDFVRRKLDEYGFAKTELSVNEWLPCRGGARLEMVGTAKQAADIAAMLVVMQNGPVDDAAIYDARQRGGAYGPLFEAHTGKPLKAYHVYLAFNELRKLGTAAKVPPLPAGVFATAAVDRSGNAAVLVANVTKSSIAGALSFGDRKVVSAKVIDAKRTYESAAFDGVLSPESVWLITLVK